MSFTNFQSKDICCKIVYFGPKDSGKTESLRSILRTTAHPSLSGTSAYLPGPARSSFFDFLPLSLGQVGGFHLKLHLFTLPSPILYPTAAQVVLKGIDAFVYVASSRACHALENQSHLEEMKNLFEANGIAITSIPGVFQYNQQDAKDTFAPAQLRRLLNPWGFADFASVAIKDQGVMDSLISVSQQILFKMAASP